MQDVIYWSLVILFQSAIATKIAGYFLTSRAKNQSIVTTLLDLGEYVYDENYDHPFTFQFFMYMFYGLNILLIWYAISFDGIVLTALAILFALTFLIESIFMLLGLQLVFKQKAEISERVKHFHPTHTGFPNKRETCN